MNGLSQVPPALVQSLGPLTTPLMYGTSVTAQAPLLAKRLFAMVSLRPPATTTPAPTSPRPLPGTLRLLLSWIQLPVMTMHEPWPDGHAPFCGAGRSPLLWLLVSMPSPLSFHSPLEMT